MQQQIHKYLKEYTLDIKIDQIFIEFQWPHNFCPIIGNTHNQLISYYPDKYKKEEEKRLERL